MILLAMALVQAAAPPPGEGVQPDEVTVIGRRLKGWRGKVSTTIGITTCRTTLSTGDKDIDAVGCTALKTCWADYRPRNDAALKAGQADPAKGIEAALGQCLMTNRDRLVAELVERRAVARSAS